MIILDSFQTIYVWNLAVALMCGIIIGAGREIRKKPAGMRTHALVIAAAMTYSYLSPTLGSGDPSRIAAHIVVGVGFLGAGIIFQARQGKIRNLTTAASVWFSAGAGMAIGFGFYAIALSAAIFTVVVSMLPKFSDLIKK